MADVQLTQRASAAGHSDYVVPATALIRLKSVRGEFRDNGAVVTWTPVVQLISDAGLGIADAVDNAATVAAGDDANASFFPGVKHAAAAAAGGTSPVLAWGHTPAGQTVAAGATTTAHFTQAFTSDPTIAAWSTVTNTNDTLTFSTEGMAMCLASSAWNSQTNSGFYFFSPAGAEMLGHDSWQLTQPYTGPPVPGTATLMDQVWLDCSSQNNSIQLYLYNGEAFNFGPYQYDASFMFFPGVFV